MGLILKKAYLNMCSCGRHGNIVLAEGTDMPEFCSKDNAIEELEMLYDDGLITDEEFVCLEEQIFLMPLLPENASDIVAMICDIINQMKREANPYEESYQPKYLM